LPGFGVNRDFFFLVVSQYPVSIDSYPIKHRGHAGLSLGLMSPLFDGEPSSIGITGIAAWGAAGGGALGRYSVSVVAPQRWARPAAK
jgi:hypothetical protein